MKFKIYHFDWELEIVDSETIGEDNWGETFYADLLIRINEGILRNKSMLKSTLIHELTHAFRWSFGHFSSVEISGYPKEELEEQVANTVELYGEDILNTANILFNKIIKEYKDE